MSQSEVTIFVAGQYMIPQACCVCGSRQAYYQELRFSPINAADLSHRRFSG